MKSFAKLVQRKRFEMLILCLVLFVQIFLRFGGCAFDLTYVVRKDEGGGKTPFCIAEGNDRYSGIGWSYPFPENGKLFEEETYFLPSIKNDYNCKFSYKERCSQIWSLKNWQIDTNTTRRYDPISDERWEEFPSYYITNATKEFSNRIELSRFFNLGFSVRASGNIEFSVCEGWDPKKYSCYFFNVTNVEIKLTKHLGMVDNNANESRVLDSYKAFSNIISMDEWRNFQIGMDKNGEIQLRDTNLNRTLIEIIDKFPLRPAYFFFTSKQPSIWKIHENNFFYTKSAQISRLGPSLKLISNDLCVSIFVNTCTNCTMSFFIIENGTRSMIEQKLLRRDEDWSLIRLNKENLIYDHINIFVETAYRENVEKNNGFWAIDNVRVCHKNEVKISNLKTFNHWTDEIACHVVDKPNLRPNKRIYDYVKEYPNIESETDSSSINLTWSTAKTKDIPYFITYQASDICTEPPFNLKRLQSNGFEVINSNQISLNNLIPYTTYNIKFYSILHTTEKNLIINTKDSPYISLEEQPSRIQVQDLTDTSVKISWDKVDCKNIYGHIFYNIKISEKSSRTNFFSGLTDNTKFINNLKPYTTYTLNITTSRNILSEEEMGRKYSTSISFITKPGLASQPKNLEIYATSNNSLSLRYNIANDKKGHPVELHFTRCNPLTLKKCKTLQLPVTPCVIFNEKFCFDIQNLIPHQKQMVTVRLKNEGSHTFGEEAVVEGFTEERVPGQPTNITTKLVDCTTSVEYCNLNITWLHPYDQNGTITAFDILLNTTEENVKGKMFNEIHTIKDGKYSRQYTHQIKYIPFSMKYNLYIQSVNNFFKSPFTLQTVIHTANLGDQLDQSPKLIKTSADSVEFQLKPPDSRLQTIITVIVQDFNESISVNEKIMGEIELSDNLCNEFGDTWISQVVKVDSSPGQITIGKSDSSGKSLKPETKYCITFLMENNYQNSSHENVYYETFTTPSYSEESKDGSNSFWIIPVIVIILILIGVLVWFLRKRCSRKSKTRDFEMEHAYETLPFDDNIVNNNLYNRLQHK